ncbi:MAG: imidazole glycerol phosphate synthase subunit HisH [Acidobacteriota bacterium]
MSTSLPISSPVVESPTARLAQRAAGTRAVVIDAGVGNLGNLSRALRFLGAEVEVTNSAEDLDGEQCLVLPGVGAFRPPREQLRGAMEEALHQRVEAGAWLLGICVGYQLLFTAGDEHGETDGLGLLPGRITRLPDTVPLPHIGWTPLRPQLGCGSPPPEAESLLAGVLPPVESAERAGAHVYFVHSYAPDGVPDSAVWAKATHGRPFVAVAGRGRVMGTQFHPEKSGPAGLRLLANFLNLAHGREENSDEL